MISPRDDVAASAEEKGNFRQRSARRRRERMRARLLDATAAACAAHGSGNVALQDILEAGKVSRGTFYAHFDSLQDPVSIIARQLIDEAQEENVRLYEDVHDSLLRIAVGPLLMLTRAVLQPAWANTIVLSGEIMHRSAFVVPIRREIVANMRARNFDRSDVRAAVDLHVGAMLQGARSLQKQAHARGKYIRDIDYNLLLAFGTPPGRARETIERASADLEERAPRMLQWWSKLD